MASRLKCLTISVLLVALLTASLHAADIDQIFSISKKLDLHNSYPRVAIDPETGNAFVAWVRIDVDGEFKTRIYATLCKLGGTDKYRAKTARLLSDPEKESQWWCDIAYNPDDDSILVVWGPAGLHARKIKGNGKVEGGIQFVYSGSASRPVIAYSDSVPAAPATLTSGYLISYANYNQITLGLWTVFSDADGNKLGSPEKISEGHSFPDGYPTQILRDLNGTYLIAHIKEDPTYGDTVHVTRVDKDGSPVAESCIGTVDPGSCSIAQRAHQLPTPSSGSTALVSFPSPRAPYYHAIKTAPFWILKLPNAESKHEFIPVKN